MNETGLFFKTSVDKSFLIKGQKCEEGKSTIFLERKNHLLFGSLAIKQLSVVFKSPQKAWKTTNIFTNINTI